MQTATEYASPQLEETPECRYLRLCRAAGAQLEADTQAAYDKYNAAMRAIDEEFSSGNWPWWKV